MSAILDFGHPPQVQRARISANAGAPVLRVESARAKAAAVTHFNLEITALCNQRCVYCFNDSGPTRRNTQLPKELWQRFLEHQIEFGLKSVHITGGEPFVNPDAMEIITAAQQLGLTTSVLSNGYRVPALIKRFAAQFKKLSVAQISLDAARAAAHDSRRGKAGAWRDALAAIRALRRAGVPCEISCTLTIENLKDLERLAAFCRRLALKLVVRPIVSLGRANDSALKPVEASLLNRTRAEIEQNYPDTVVHDKFWYVPDHSSFDSKARDRGIVTILPDGKFRGGRTFFPPIERDFMSAVEVLAVGGLVSPRSDLPHP
jgi:MoaA/NifB/PqqE/SkfB family radical SAM enzyme